MISQLKFLASLMFLVNRSILCNCGIEAENNFLLESLAAYHDAESKLVMYFMVNTAFVNYPDNLTESLIFPIFLNQTSHKQPYQFLYSLLTLILTYQKDHKYTKILFTSLGIKTEISDLHKRHNSGLDLANKNSFLVITP